MRQLMWISKIYPRLLMIGLIALTCLWLASKTSALGAIGIWAAVIAAVCGGVALLMHVQKPGRITPINYIAGIVLPWGFAIGRGKLLPIVIESALRWLLVGVAVIILRTHSQGVIVPVLLFASWMID